MASFKVANNLAKAKKLHIIAEHLIKPCVLDMGEIILGETASKKFGIFRARTILFKIEYF